jgi:hypothetical protein
MRVAASSRLTELTYLSGGSLLSIVESQPTLSSEASEDTAQGSSLARDLV